MLYPKRNYEGKKFNQESKVETAGFIPQSVRIQNLIDSGRRLIQSRSQTYDYPDGNYDENAPVPDITRRPNYDMADAFQDSLAINERINLKAKSLKDSTPEVAIPKSEEVAPKSEDEPKK